MSTMSTLFFMDDFAIRQFTDASYQGTRIASTSPEAFTAELNRRVTDASQLRPGYAPFCKCVRACIRSSLDSAASTESFLDTFLWRIL